MENKEEFLKNNVINVKKSPFIKRPGIRNCVRPGGIVVESGKKPFFRIIKK